jgi:hypothetical protein
VALEGQGTDRFAVTASQHDGQRRSTGRFDAFGQRPMGYCHRTSHRRQQRIGDAAALFDRLVHRILDRVGEPALAPEACRVGDGLQADRPTSSEDAKRYAIASQTRRKFVGERHHHCLQPWLGGDRDNEIEARRGARNIGGEIFGSPHPGEGLEPAGTPAELLGDVLGTEYGSARRRG